MSLNYGRNPQKPRVQKIHCKLCQNHQEPVSLHFHSGSEEGLRQELRSVILAYWDVLWPDIEDESEAKVESVEVTVCSVPFRAENPLGKSPKPDISLLRYRTNRRHPRSPICDVRSLSYFPQGLTKKLNVAVKKNLPVGWLVEDRYPWPRYESAEKARRGYTFKVQVHADEVSMHERASAYSRIRQRK